MELITLSEHEYTITYNNQVNEDGQLGINVFLGKGFADEVYVTFSVTSNSIFSNGNSFHQLTFAYDELDSVDYTKTVYLSPLDDLLIESTIQETIYVTFQEKGSAINEELSQQLSVDIIDNDFQRSVDEDQSKLPSGGNNKIVYDLDMSANDQWLQVS